MPRHSTTLNVYIRTKKRHSKTFFCEYRPRLGPYYNITTTTVSMYWEVIIIYKMNFQYHLTIVLGNHLIIRRIWVESSRIEQSFNLITILTRAVLPSLPCLPTFYHTECSNLFLKSIPNSSNTIYTNTSRGDDKYWCISDVFTINIHTKTIISQLH